MAYLKLFRFQLSGFYAGYMTASVKIHEQTEASLASRLNWLRAGVLGANDGIVSTAGIVVGVAGAMPQWNVLLSSGIAGMVAGALSMAVGEYISVSSQRDAEKAKIEREELRLKLDPVGQMDKLTDILEKRGISSDLSRQVAMQLSERDALAAHISLSYGIDKDDLTNPIHAALASFLSFLLGAVIPLLAILASPPGIRISLTVAAVILALVITGWVSARLGEASPRRATIRNVVGGLIAMGTTYLIGSGIGIIIG